MRRAGDLAHLRGVPLHETGHVQQAWGAAARRLRAAQDSRHGARGPAEQGPEVRIRRLASNLRAGRELGRRACTCLARDTIAPDSTQQLPLCLARSSAPRAGASAAHAGAKGPKVEVRGGLAAVGQPAPQALAPAVADVAMAEGDAVDRAGAAAAGVAGGDGQAVAVAPFPVAPGAALGPALGKRPAEGNAADEAERKRARSATQFDLPDTALAAGAPGPDAPAQEERAELGAAPKLPAPTRMQTRGRHVVIPGVKRVEKVDTEAGVGPLQRGPLPGGAGQGATPGVDPGVPVPIAPLAPNARPVLPIGGEGEAARTGFAALA